MRLIAVDSSGPVASVAVYVDGVVEAEYSVEHKKTHSQTLLPMLDECKKITELEPDTVDAIAVAAGPGSFTGLRIGAATVKGLSFALKKPVVPVPTLEAMAYRYAGVEGLICPMMDARRSQVYGAVYTWEDGMFKEIKKAGAYPVEEIIDFLNALGEGEDLPVQAILLGDGVEANLQSLKDGMLIPYMIAPPHMCRQSAAAVAVLGEKYFSEGKVVAGEDFAPEYFRVSQAERERAEKEKQS